ncbi:MAG: nitrite reductase small subunit NirD [Actinomycetes bacterium]
MIETEPVCHVAELLPERPAAALVDGAQVAIVRLHDDRVFAVGMWCPFARANVMARGLVGSKVVEGEDVPVIFSPMYKQPFDLRTGDCVTDAGVSLGSWDVAVVDGYVHVGAQLTPERPGRGVRALATAS